MAKRSRTLKRHARAMRHEPTRAEAKLWKWLRSRQFSGHKFRRQVPIGRYILDFYCPGLHLVIEVDGSQHREPWMSPYDSQRTRYLAARGIRVIRIPNEQLLTDDRSAVAAVAWAVECHRGQ